MVIPSIFRVRRLRKRKVGVKVISLGSPLSAVPLDVPGVVDQTRGILTYVEANCLSPKSLGIEWICLAGTYKTGVKEFSANVFLILSLAKATNKSGTADARGDGITPVESAQLQLEGVENIILEGVFHTPVGSNNEDRPWYGTKNSRRGCPKYDGVDVCASLDF